MRQHHAAFANFICRFGDKVLVDYAKEVVLPAFFDDKLVRTYGDRTHFHFYDMALERLNDDRENPILGICGRFIKDTQLSRTQIFDPDRGLIKDEQSIRSSPSAFFVLVLNNHRLIYFPETPHAPELKPFEVTVSLFLRTKHTEFINGIYERLRTGGEKVSKKQLRETHPAPSLEIVPLTGFDDIDQFVKRYEKLKKLELRLIRPNDDIDGEKTFQDLREYLDGIDPKTTKLISSNPDGLDKAKAIEVIHDASAAGNQEVKLSGLDAEGNNLDGNNDNFKVTAELEEIPPTNSGLAKKLFRRFTELVSNDAIRVSSQPAEVAQRIMQIMRTLL